MSNRTNARARRAEKQKAELATQDDAKTETQTEVQTDTQTENGTPEVKQLDTDKQTVTTQDLESEVIDGDELAKVQVGDEGTEDGTDSDADDDADGDTDSEPENDEPTSAPASAPATPVKPEVTKDAPKQKKQVHASVKPVEAPKQDEPIAVVLIKQHLQSYEKVMFPGRPHTDREGSAAQAQLYRAIMGVLRTEGVDFHKAMAVLCKFVGENRKGLFNERYCFRYMDSVALSSGERQSFENLLHVLITLWDPRSRAVALKQIDLPKALIGIKDENIHQRVHEFFAVV